VSDARPTTSERRAQPPRVSLGAADHWPVEREGYGKDIPIAYAPLNRQRSAPQLRRWIRAEERLGSLIAGGGTIWTAYAVTNHYAGITRIGILPPGPLEVCAIGILIWLHAKWRKSVQTR
jgi:hypothetical protein